MESNTTTYILGKLHHTKHGNVKFRLKTSFVPFQNSQCEGLRHIPIYVSMYIYSYLHNLTSLSLSLSPSLGKKRLLIPKKNCSLSLSLSPLPLVLLPLLTVHSRKGLLSALFASRCPTTSTVPASVLTVGALNQKEGKRQTEGEKQKEGEKQRCQGRSSSSTC